MAMVMVMLPLGGKLGEGHTGTLCSIFATSESKITSKLKVYKRNSLMNHSNTVALKKMFCQTARKLKSKVGKGVTKTEHVQGLAPSS